MVDASRRLQAAVGTAMESIMQHLSAANTIDVRRALLDAREAYTIANPASGRLHAEACAAMPGGNTRTVLFYEPFPLAMLRGEGAMLWDADGHAYLDLLGDYSAGLYGHSHPVIREAVEAALAGGISLGSHTAIEARLAAALRERFPSLELLRFTNSGTEANLMAVTLARLATGRRKVMVFEGAYHGAVFAFPTSAGAPVNAPFEFVVASYNDARGARELIARHAADLAVVMVEPMLGAGGCVPAEPEFLAVLRQETERHGVVLLFDEVMTSRLAPGGLQGALGMVPDLTTLGKYIGGGMSFGCFGGRAELMSRFDPRRPDALAHAGTFNNNVLSMSAGLAGLTRVYTADAARTLNDSGDALREELNACCAAAGAGLQFTGRGSMMTAHFHPGEVRSARDVAAGDPLLKELLFFHLLGHGVYLARRGMITLSLPVGAAERQRLLDAVRSFLDTYGHLLPPG